MNGSQSVQATFKSCSPRPPVTVSSAPDGSGGLRVTVSAGADLALHSVQFGASTNALIDVPGRGTSSGGFSVDLGQSSQLSFTVRRQSPGAATVPLTVTDDCGSWPTFVGGGPGAF
jgi:hypothetical protein